MNIISIIIGILVLGSAFGLMVWGQKYLGEEKGRNAGKSDTENAGTAMDNPCRNCGGCEEKSPSPDP